MSTYEKPATTSVPIHELLAARWSPRAFDGGRPLAREQVLALLEAARWAPSCYGDQPWRYVVCDRSVDEPAWTRLFDCLAEGNRVWARHAPLLLLCVADSRFRQNDKPNRWGQYDCGASSENLVLQAVALGLAAHQMGGFDADKARDAFGIPERFTPMSVIAVGHPAPPDGLPDDLRAMETGPRKRARLGEQFFAGAWERPLTPD